MRHRTRRLARPAHAALLRAKRPDREPRDGRDGVPMQGQSDKAPRKMLGANGFRYKEKFGVIVMCKDEAEHKAVYERLKAEGYKCKVVRV